MKKAAPLPSQTFEVWHISNRELITEGYLYPDGCIARWLNNYENYIMVAEVAASSLEEVFDMTQNVEDTWTKNPHVLWSKSHDLRSTSVGDVLVHNGKAWLVAWQGFTKINKN
jgi:hypothetical protein